MTVCHQNSGTHQQLTLQVDPKCSWPLVTVLRNTAQVRRALTWNTATPSQRRVCRGACRMKARACRHTYHGAHEALGTFKTLTVSTIYTAGTRPACSWIAFVDTDNALLLRAFSSLPMHPLLAGCIYRVVIWVWGQTLFYDVSHNLCVVLPACSSSAPAAARLGSPRMRTVRSAALQVCAVV